MSEDKKLGKIVVGGLELALRPADERDMGFCYELMGHNMRVLFDRNTQEGWSRVKFRSGFNPNRITIVEHEGMSIGFYDYEIIEDELYWHNVQLSEDFQIGVGTRIFRLVEQAARRFGAEAIIGKVFFENSRAIQWIQRFGFQIDEIIENENSYWMRKYLGETNEIF